jgi:hypothetical protein
MGDTVGLRSQMKDSIGSKNGTLRHITDTKTNSELSVEKSSDASLEALSFFCENKKKMVKTRPF